MSALESVSALFSPTYLFLFLNLIIGTIFLTSRRPRPAKFHPVPLARAPSSLIDRVRSINLSLYKFDAHPQVDPVQHYYTSPAREVDDDGSPPPPPLARAPSLLDRLRSVDFYHRKFENVNPEPPQPHEVDPPAPPTRAPSTLLDRLKSMNYYYEKFAQPSDPPHEAELPADEQVSAPLARVPSLLDRVRSIKFPSLYDPDRHDEEGNHQDKDKGHGAVRRIRSESERMGEEEKGKGRKARMRKTASEKSKEEEDEEEELGTEEINAKADDFIQMFRKQLRLQRLDSIMGYKDRLTGGGR
ncbi:hypothetical protein MLD38_015063 [Melastoma candidum]|uniref:Uncharacterized protein n=1 Tax=Melastoma candidum TaxID=119954 RepID=A0ACB9REW2_9MYRT|nr:hypothetical protein MLD38_015063 [Melastoma candidum]